MPVPQGTPRPEVSSARCGFTMAVAGGSTGGQRWWSVTTTRMPAASAQRTASTAVMPSADGLPRGDAAVAGQDEPGPDRPGLVEAGLPEIVAVAQPVGNERLGVSAADPEGAG